MGYLPGPRHGQEIVLASTLAVVGGVAATLAVGGIDGESLRAAMRLTARTSFVLFLPAFVASSLHAFWPSPATRWLLAHRRFLGISFAISHLIHAATIFAEAWRTGGRSLEGRTADLIGGGVIYLFIVAMLATSFDRTAAMLGRRAWTIVHTVGAYLVWLAMFGGVSGRIVESPLYALPTALLVSALALRLARRVARSRKKRAARAG